MDFKFSHLLLSLFAHGQNSQRSCATEKCDQNFN